MLQFAYSMIRIRPAEHSGATIDQATQRNTSFVTRRTSQLFPAILLLISCAPFQAEAVIRLGQSNTVSLSRGLVLYLPLDGSTINWSTNTFYDLAGNGNNASSSGMSVTTSPAAGKIGQSLMFDGANGVLQENDSQALNITGNLTFSTWVKWGASSVHFNGALDTTVPWSTDPGTNGEPIKIGSDHANGSYVNGLMDDIRIYNRALSAGKVQQLYHLGTRMRRTQMSAFQMAWWATGRWTAPRSTGARISGTRPGIPGAIHADFFESPMVSAGLAEKNWV